MTKYLSSLLLLASLIVAGCAGISAPKISDHGIREPVKVGSSYLAKPRSKIQPGEESSADSKDLAVSAASEGANRVTELAPIPRSGAVLSERLGIIDLVSELSDNLVISADNMPITDFIHYVFGELLQVNYVLDQAFQPGTSSSIAPVTLSLSNDTDSVALFTLVSDVLLKRGIDIQFGEESLYIYQMSTAASNKPEVVIGVGRNVSDVPQTPQAILQIVPLNFGIKLKLQSMLAQLTGALVTPDFDQNALFVKGRREDVLRVLELIDLLDVPAARGRFISMINLDNVSPSEFTGEVMQLLRTEGVISTSGQDKDRSIVLIPLEKLGAVAIFSATQVLLDRVEYWASVVDVLGGGSDQQYFIYEPKYARALDLGESLSKLLSLRSTGGSNDFAKSPEGGSTGNAPSTSRTSGMASDKIKMVVDERANALLFFTTGSEYRSIKPLMNKLDTMPRQVAMDILIAEVSLKDEFKHGVEWAVSRGDVSLTTQGAFGATTIGGIGLSINGSEGPLDANFLATNSLVTVLSNPTLTVRDGVSATINVGSDIAVVGETTQDPINGERQTTSTVYRQTGVDVTVLPTINAKGIVVMEIQQSISNSIPNASGANGNPDIFSRSVSTEVVARSGQTVMLGGLVSQNNSTGGSGAPGLSNIPLLGNLFKSKSQGSDRTELVMLITPRVLDDLDQWESVSADFRGALRYLEVGGEQ